MIKSGQFILGLLILALFVSAPLNLAQDTADDTSTPAVEETPSPGYPITFQYDLGFPQRLDIRGSFETEASTIASLVLEIAPDDRPVTVINYPQDEAFRSDAVGFVLATYVYPISLENPPTLFSNINITWTLTTADGVVYEFAEQIQYADQRVEWRTIQDEANRFEVIYPSDFSLNASSFFARSEALYELMAERADLTRSFRFLLYPTALTPGCEINASNEPVVNVVIEGNEQLVPCNLDLALRVLEASEYELIQASSSNDFLNRLRDHIFDAYYLTLWEDNAVPAWFDFGLRRFISFNPSPISLDVSRNAVRSGRPILMSQMTQYPEDARGQVNRQWEAQAYGMVLYISDTIGVDRLFILAEAAGNTPDFATAYQNITGESIDLLLPEWQDWIFSARAERAHGYTPYQETTPTPQPTVTMTPQPTPTLEPTAEDDA